MVHTIAHTLRRRATRSASARSGQSGFTLVELAIVLAVIGLIIGAVAIGKDVQRNAEYTKVKNKFIDQWEQAYNQYYQRTGVVLGDSQTAPRIMVNGANYNLGAGVTQFSGGDMSGAALPGRICDKAVGVGMETAGRTAAALTTMRDMFARTGVRMPPGRAEGFEDRYVYLDTNGNPQEIQVCFQWNRPIGATGTLGEGSGNMMIISGLTPDLARMLDQMIDGKPDAQEGRFRMQGVQNGTPNVPGTEWTGTNTDQFGSAPTAATTATPTPTGRRLDEDQVLTVVAIYKMNQ